MFDREATEQNSFPCTPQAIVNISPIPIKSLASPNNNLRFRQNQIKHMSRQDTDLMLVPSPNEKIKEAPFGIPSNLGAFPVSSEQNKQEQKNLDFNLSLTPAPSLPTSLPSPASTHGIGISCIC